MRIIWTSRAFKSFFRVYDFTKESQGDKQARNLTEQTRTNIRRIREHPNICPAYKERKNLRKGLITKYVSMFYRIRPRKKEIELLKFHDNRQDPKKINL